MEEKILLINGIKIIKKNAHLIKYFKHVRMQDYYIFFISCFERFHKKNKTTCFDKKFLVHLKNLFAKNINIYLKSTQIS